MTPNYSIIPCELRSDVDHARAHHLDLDSLPLDRAWAEHQLIRQHLARLTWTKRRRLQTVRMDGHDIIDERAWCVERLAHLDRLLSRRGRVA